MANSDSFLNGLVWRAARLCVLSIFLASAPVLSSAQESGGQGGADGQDVKGLMRSNKSGARAGGSGKVVAQSQAVTQQTQEQRIQELERKLQSVTEELQGLKSEGVADDRLQSIEEKLSILAQEIDNIKQVSVIPEPTYEQMFGA